MKKFFSLSMAALLLTTPLAQVHAQTQESQDSGDSSAEAKDQNEGVLGDLANANSRIGKTVSILVQQLQADWEKTGGKMIEKMKSSLGPRLEKELNRYRLSQTIGLKNQSLINNLLSGEATYGIVVEPTGRGDEQVRRDIYTFGLGAGKGIDTHTENLGAGVNGKIQMRVTFSRVYSGQDAKYRAILNLPYGMDKLPLSADGIKEKMKVGDTIRVEILGNAGGGISSGKTQKLGSVGIGGGYTRDALFMVEMYRHSLRDMRIRSFGLKNRGTFNVSASGSFTPWNAWAPQGIIGKVGGAVKDATEAGAHVGFSKTADLFNDFPLDTMMLDYVYKFQSEQPGSTEENTAEAAITELLGHVRRMGFTPLFNLFASDKDLGQTLKNQAAISEKLAKEDYALGANARVRHLFKGRITSNVFTTNIGGSGTMLLGSLDQTLTSMKSFVRTEDTLDRRSYYILESASEKTDTKSSIIVGRSEEKNSQDLDILMKADENKNVTALLDMVKVAEVRDDDMSKSEIDRLKNILSVTTPPSLLDPSLSSFFPEEKQKNAFFRSRYIMGLETFTALTQLKREQINSALYHFLDDHPKRNYMNLPAYVTNGGPNLNFRDYVKKLADLIYQVVSSEFSAEQKAQALHILIREPIFQRYLAGEFLAKLVPAESAKDLTSLSLQFSSEQTSPEYLVMGKQKTSDIYRYVSFVRSILNDRSYDLRLETQINEDGTQLLVTPQIKGFSANQD